MKNFEKNEKVFIEAEYCKLGENYHDVRTLEGRKDKSRRFLETVYDKEIFSLEEMKQRFGGVEGVKVYFRDYGCIEDMRLDLEEGHTVNMRTKPEPCCAVGIVTIVPWKQKSIEDLIETIGEDRARELLEKEL